MDQLNKFTRILGISALVFYMPIIGYLFGWATSVEFYQLAFGDQAVEDFKYVVTIVDSVGISDKLR